MSVVGVAMLFDSASDVHGRQQGKDERLDECYHDLDEVQEQCEQGDYRGDHEALENKDQTEEAQQDDVACSDVGEQPDHQGEWLHKYTYDLNRDHDDQQRGRYAGRCQKVFVIVAICIQVDHDECQNRQCHRDGDITCKVGRAREQAHDVVDQNEEEQREQVGQVFFVFRAYVRFHHFVADEEDDYLHG